MQRAYAGFSGYFHLACCVPRIFSTFLVFGGPRFCRTGGFFKKAVLFSSKKPRQEKPGIWENVVRNAKNRPWNATRQLFSGYFQGILRVFAGCFQGISGGFLALFSVSFRVFWGCFQGVSRLSSGCFALCPFWVCPVHLSHHEEHV